MYSVRLQSVEAPNLVENFALENDVINLIQVTLD